jgi:hypothetical protein
MGTSASFSCTTGALAGSPVERLLRRCGRLDADPAGPGQGDPPLEEQMLAELCALGRKDGGHRRHRRQMWRARLDGRPEHGPATEI